MRVMIMGAGGLGGYLAACLARAGADVSVVGRGAHLQAMARDGLTLVSGGGEERVAVRAAADPQAAGPADLIILAVKLYDVEAAVAAAAPMLAEGGVLVTVQNGVDAPAMAARILGPERVAAAAAYVSARIDTPGVVLHTGAHARLDLGSRAAPPAVMAAIADLGRRAGLDVVEAPDIEAALWEKFTFFSASSGVTALTRLPLGPLRDDPLTAGLLTRAIAEAAAVARALGVAVPDDLEARTAAVMAGKSPALKPSLLVDLERGRRLEVDWIAGTIHRAGLATGIDTPVQSCIYAALKPFSGGGLPGEKAPPASS